MPISLTCSHCDQAMKLQEDVSSGAFPCPRCGTRIYLGDREEIEREEALEEERKERRRRKGKKKQRERIEGISNVNLGLGFHFAGVMVFMVALWMYWLALAIALATMLTGGVTDTQTFGFLNFVVTTAIVVGGLATMLEIPAGILCLFVPDGASKGLAIASLSLRGCMIGTSLWFGLSRHGEAVILNGILLVAAFIVWMFFLRRLASYLQQHEIARDTLRILLQGVWTALAILIFLLFLSLMIRLFVYVQSPFGRMLVISCIAGPLATFVAAWYKLSEGDSILKVVLYPTGITFILRYLEFLSSLRMTLLRRA